MHENIMINRQVARSREWMFEALIKLLEKKPYEDIKISNITHKAGVARQTFYRNYENKDDIIVKYIDTIFDEFILETKQIQVEECVSTVYTLFFQVLLRHKSALLKIKNVYLTHLLFNVFWSYHKIFLQYLYLKNYETIKDFNEYFIKYQLGGIVSITMEWLQNDMQTKPEELGTMIDKITQPYREQAAYLPALIHNF